MTLTHPFILKIAVPTPLPTELDYLLPDHWDVQKLQSGMRMRVPFRNKNLIGVLIAIDNKSFLPLKKLKYALEIVDETPLLDKTILDLAQWSANYYHYPIGEVMSACLPKKLRNEQMDSKLRSVSVKQKNDLDKLDKQEKQSVLPVLNDYQKFAMTQISHDFHQFKVYLLHGVTGSGKTEVYLHLIEKVMKAGRQILVLVPEIGLTPQTVKRFVDRFKIPIAVLHSSLNNSERLEAWLAAQNSTAKIIIGTRSAVFTPMPDLGLIIIDEEHDASYKQQDSFRYHARDVAIMRARQQQLPIVLGSATPSLESIHNVKQKKYDLLILPERAGSAQLPLIKMIDIRNQVLLQGLSAPLLTAIKKHLDAGGQILLFINRRGFAPILICHHCGWCAACDGCDSRLVFHKKESKLHCHHCHKIIPVFAHCPACGGQTLVPLGLGTQRIESVLEKYFPAIGMARVDRDNTRKKKSFNEILDSIHQGKIKILIGTQMLAKGHHFPEVTLVAILDVDYGFFSTEMRAQERIGQIITQVAGRAGRENRRGEVLIQTRHPNHPDLQYLIQNNYIEFAELLLSQRKQANLPPYSYHALIRAEAHDKNLVMDFLLAVKDHGIQTTEKKIKFLGPIDAPVARIANKQRVQLLIQADSRAILQKKLGQLLKFISNLKTTNKLRWSLDVDPQDFY